MALSMVCSCGTLTNNLTVNGVTLDFAVCGNQFTEVALHKIVIVCRLVVRAAKWEFLGVHECA
jgi:hypothetical protein